LAIKSTEYKAIDDTNAHKYDEDSVEAQNLHGFNFTHLRYMENHFIKYIPFYISRRKYEHLQDALTQFRIHLSELDELAPLKQWQVSDISLQAAQQIMQVSPDQALSVLIDLAQNFPIRARLAFCWSTIGDIYPMIRNIRIKP
jgi:S-adenosylmethionine:diacylglycerol 3-amino-3-carboxypropyl transferase